MSSKESKKKLIIDVFNEMDFEDKSNFSDQERSNNNLKAPEKCFFDEICFSNELLKTLPVKKEPKLWNNAVGAATEAQTKWKNFSALERANFLHIVWESLKKISMSLSKYQNEFLILVDYFDFYSDLAVQMNMDYKTWRPYGVVLIILSNNSPLFVLGAAVATALATGCSVVVAAPKSSQIVALLLEEVFAESGLPDGLLSVLADINDINISQTKKINKVFFCGSYLSAKTFYLESSVKSFSFFCPNNTAALILESSDLEAAVNKIVSETWGKNYFAVSNVVVQESVLTKFLEKLKYRIEQFMIENKNSVKFKDEILAEKINKTIIKAVQAGALVERTAQYNNKWSPTVLLNYQSQDIIEDVPVLKVLSCRSAKEGVNLLNNCRYSLGISIWSEISSQALEVSSMLVCPNTWINCHGMIEPAEPIQLTGFSGNCVLGGSDGMLEYLSFGPNDPVEGSECNETKDNNIDKVKVLQTAFAAHEAFNSWKSIKNRREHLKDLANSLEDHKELAKLSRIISSYAHLRNTVNSFERNSIQKFETVKRKVPIGVILLFVNTSIIDFKFLAALITPTIALGNAVIFVLKEENPSVEVMIKYFSKTLPKQLVSLIFGQEAVIQLASDPHIQAVWFYDESGVSTEFLKKIKTHTESLKRIWVIPQNVPFSEHLLQKKCLQNKMVWQTKIDQFL